MRDGRPTGSVLLSVAAVAALPAALAGLLWSRLRGGGGPRLRLGHSLGAFPRPGGGISPLYVFFMVTNAGEDEATVAGLHVEPKGGRPVHVVHLLEGEGRPPGVLAPGETVRFRVRAKALAHALEDAGYGGRPRVDLVVSDESGGRFARRFRLRVDEYLALKDE